MGRIQARPSSARLRQHVSLSLSLFLPIYSPHCCVCSIRFKDPEPSDRIDDAPPTHQASMTGTSRHLSDTDDNASSASVSAASSPTFPSTPLPSVPEHDHQTRSSSSSKLAAKKGGGRPGPARRRRSASTGSDVSTASMAYERAPSVGVEGPLLEQQFDQDESTSPRSTASLSLDDADHGSETAGRDGEEEDVEDGYEYVSRQQDQESTDKHSSVRARKNLPRGGPSFGFTGMDK